MNQSFLVAKYVPAGKLIALLCKVVYDYPFLFWCIASGIAIGSGCLFWPRVEAVAQEQESNAATQGSIGQKILIVTGIGMVICLGGVIAFAIQSTK